MPSSTGQLLPRTGFSHARLETVKISSLLHSQNSPFSKQQSVLWETLLRSSKCFCVFFPEAFAHARAAASLYKNQCFGVFVRLLSTSVFWCAACECSLLRVRLLGAPSLLCCLLLGAIFDSNTASGGHPSLKQGSKAFGFKLVDLLEATIARHAFLGLPGGFLHVHMNHFYKTVYCLWYCWDF